MQEGRWPQYSHEPSWRVLTPKEKAGRAGLSLETSGSSLPRQLPGTGGLAAPKKGPTVWQPGQTCVGALPLSLPSGVASDKQSDSQLHFLSVK